MTRSWGCWGKIIEAEPSGKRFSCRRHQRGPTILGPRWCPGEGLPPAASERGNPARQGREPRLVWRDEWRTSCPRPGMAAVPPPRPRPFRQLTPSPLAGMINQRSLSVPIESAVFCRRCFHCFCTDVGQAPAALPWGRGSFLSEHREELAAYHHAAGSSMRRAGRIQAQPPTSSPSARLPPPEAAPEPKRSAFQSPARSHRGCRPAAVCSRGNSPARRTIQSARFLRPPAPPRTF